MIQKMKLQILLVSTKDMDMFRMFLNSVKISAGDFAAKPAAVTLLEHFGLADSTVYFDMEVAALKDLILVTFFGMTKTAVMRTRLVEVFQMACTIQTPKSNFVAEMTVTPIVHETAMQTIEYFVGSQNAGP